MHDAKMLVSWIVIFAAAGLAYRLGYKAKSPKRYGGVIGTFLVCAFYGLLPFLAMAILFWTIIGTGFWRDQGEWDMGPLFTPLIMSPVYWISISLGMWRSKGE
jgi:hypothetical protein